LRDAERVSPAGKGRPGYGRCDAHGKRIRQGVILIFSYWFHELQILEAELREVISLCEEKSGRQPISDIADTLLEDDHTNFRLERCLFYTAIAIRKLLEAHSKAPSVVPNWRGQPLRDLPESIKSDRFHFADDMGRNWTRSTDQLVNEIIHSSHISWSDQPNAELFSGFWLASDRNEGLRSLFVDWDTYLRIIGTIARVEEGTST